MVHINIICIGKLKEEYLKKAQEEYLKRLKKYCEMNIIEINDEQLPTKINDSIIEQIKEKECKKIMEYIKNDSYVIPLDLRGKQCSSEEFSSKLENIQLQGYSNITLIIGGTLGLTDEILRKSNEIICFSRMTFPHQLIRIFLLEQIFRAFKIAKNETYHW